VPNTNGLQHYGYDVIQAVFAEKHNRSFTLFFEIKTILKQTRQYL